MPKSLDHVPSVKVDTTFERSATPDSVVSAPPGPSSNVFTNFIKKVPNQISPALKRRVNKRDSNPGNEDKVGMSQQRSAVSQILHSVPGAVKKKLSRGVNSPDLPRWESEEELEYNANLRPRNFGKVLEQIKTRDTPLLSREMEIRDSIEGPIQPITMVTLDTEVLDSDDDNAEPDGFLSSVFGQVNTIELIDNEIIKIKSEIEVTQRSNTELTKKYLEQTSSSDTNQLANFAVREQYNERNLKSQKHVRDLQRKLKSLEDRKRKIKEQETATLDDLEIDQPIERQKTPDQNRIPAVIHGVVKKAVARRRRNRPDSTKQWGSDGALDSSGIIDIAETVKEEINYVGFGSKQDDGTKLEISYLTSDDDEHVQINNNSNDSDVHGPDSASNISDHVQEKITKLQEDYNSLFEEVMDIKQAQKDILSRFDEEFVSLDNKFVCIQEALDEQFRVFNEKLDSTAYSSDERIKEIEDRLDRYRNKMTEIEQIQEQRRAEGPLTGNDFANRGRDLLSSLISLGLAIVSFILFVVTNIVDFVRLFTENNMLSTVLALGLFGVVIALYYHFIENKALLFNS